MIGVGTYANNETCAISTTGEGGYLTGIIAYDICAAMCYKNISLQEACDYVIHEKHKHSKGIMGVIAVDKEANLVVCFNSDRMHRAWKHSGAKRISAFIPRRRREEEVRSKVVNAIY